MEWLRTSLWLSRTVSLPTVWSNILAGWWLGGGGTTREMPMLLLGMSCLHLGTAVLNDAAKPLDQQHRRLRVLTREQVYGRFGSRLFWVCLACGLAAGFWCGASTGLFALLCACALILFQLTQKASAVAAVFLGLFRLALYLSGASVSSGGATGLSAWSGIALGLFVAGIHIFGVVNRSSDFMRVWPLIFLLAPPALAILINAGVYREPALLLCAVLGLWLVMALRHTWWSETPDLNLTIPGLQSGIVIADWLAAVNGPRILSAIFILLMLFSVMLQRLPVMPAAGGAREASR